jgi:hypothetical protein
VRDRKEGKRGGEWEEERKGREDERGIYINNFINNFAR